MHQKITHLFCGGKLEAGANLNDPLTLEPLTAEKPLLHFQCGNSIVTYDFTVFYNAIHRLNDYRIPHTRETLTVEQRQAFDQICVENNREPIFVHIQKKNDFMADYSECQSENDLFDLALKYGYLPLNRLNEINNHLSL
jgi:hypothetical protein